MPDALYRVAIHCETADRRSAADLVLPAEMTVSQLLPSIVDAVGVSGDEPRHWYLAPIGGAPLDEAMTLAQNEVRDGDVLVLTERAPAAPRSYGLVHALTVEKPTSAAPPELRTIGGLWVCAIGVAAVLCAGMASDGPGPTLTAAVLAAAVAALVVAAPRLGLADITPVQMLAVASVAVVGFVVVPADPGPAGVFLGAAASASMGVVLLRVTGGPVEILLAVVTFAALIGTVAGCAVVFPLGVQPFGACLGALGMGALSLSPRLSVAIAGLTPDDNIGDASPTHSDVDTRAERGHRVLFGLVAAGSAAAALGAVLVAVGGYGAVTFAAIAFDAAIGLALMLRTRSHVSGRCRTVLTATGFCALTAAFALVVAWSPPHGNWAGAVAVAGGLAVLGRVSLTGSAADRAADVVEYAALAAVAPLACWLSGVLDLVRGFGM